MFELNKFDTLIVGLMFTYINQVSTDLGRGKESLPAFELQQCVKYTAWIVCKAVPFCYESLFVVLCMFYFCIYHLPYNYIPLSL